MKSARQVAEEYAETWGLTIEEINDLEEVIENDRKAVRKEARLLNNLVSQRSET